MPTYGYRCQKCNTEFDVWQKMSDEPVAECPVCAGPGKRLYFPAGIVFKGSGFYKTDSRGGGGGSSGGGSGGRSTSHSTPSKGSSGSSPAPSSGGDSKSD